MIKFDKLILSSPARGGGEEVRSLTSLPITISKTKHITPSKKKKKTTKHIQCFDLAHCYTYSHSYSRASNDQRTIGHQHHKEEQ